MKELLVKGNKVIIDDIDFDWAFGLSWFFNGSYVRSRSKQMARYILERMGKKFEKGMCVDHINRNKLDNRRSNLRMATRSQNQANSFSAKNTSGFRGVMIVRGRRGQPTNWKSTITHNGKKIYLGVFETPQKAAIAYKEKAKEIYGEYSSV